MQESTHSLSPLSSPIPALVPSNEAGHHFICYADCCSGIPGAPNEATFAAVNRVVSRLRPQPDFICFLGDEIKGLTADDERLRGQWRYWFDEEMAWLDRDAIPLYHTTGNHTTYDRASEAVFRDVLTHLPRNGPSAQEGLSYVVRRDDLLLVFVNTAWSGLGGDGRVERAWLDQTLANHADARYKLVLGHHPVYPINGFSGPYQRHIEPMNGQAFWQVLVRHNVLAYLCSHIMAFDVQVYEGVLQIMTAGAGNMPLMPENIEYLHAVQAALDADGLRYQVLDTAGQIREWLKWPLRLPPSTRWTAMTTKEIRAPLFDDEKHGERNDLTAARLVVWKFEGISSPLDDGEAQTLLCAWSSGPSLAPLWIGLRGPEHGICLLLSAAAGRSPHVWLGPTLEPNKPFSIQIAIHTGMGPGGFLWRWNDESPWSSLSGATAWGAERLSWPTYWRIGHDQRGPDSRPFRGRELNAMWYTQTMSL